MRYSALQSEAANSEQDPYLLLLQWTNIRIFPPILGRVLTFVAWPWRTDVACD